MKKSNFGWFTLGSLVSSSLSFISIPIIAWVFNDTDIGKVALLISASGLGIILFSLGLDQSYSREYHETANQTSLMMNAMLPGILILGITTTVTLAFSPTWLSWALFGQRSWALSLFVFVYLFIMLISRFLVLSLRMREDGKRYALSFFLAKITFVSFLCLSSIQTKPGTLELLIAHGASVTVGLIYLLATTYQTWSKMRPSLIDRKLIVRLLAFGTPMATAGLLFWGLEGFDKFMLRSLSSSSELGIYSIALSIAAMANVATSMFTTIWIPIVYRWVANQEDLSRIDQVTEHLLAAIIILVGLAGTFSWLLEYVLPTQQHTVQYLIMACMLWPLFYALSETTGLGIAITRSSRLGLVIAALSLAVNVALNLLLLPRLGSSGAVVSLAFSTWVFMMLRTEVSHHIWRTTPRRRVYVWTLLALALASIHALLGPTMRTLLFACWIVFLFIACIVFNSSISQAWTWIIVSLRRKYPNPSS